MKFESFKDCPSFSEQYLIKNRAAIECPTTTKICKKHRSELGTNYRNKTASCNFPNHTLRTSGKRKASSGEFRPIPLDVLHEIKVIEKQHLCIGSQWCSGCRIKKYKQWKDNYAERIPPIDVSRCLICNEKHSPDEDDLPSASADWSSDSADESSQDEYEINISRCNC